MSEQTPVGVIPASKAVRRTIEVAIFRATFGNSTLDPLRCANCPPFFIELECGEAVSTGLQDCPLKLLWFKAER